MTPFELQEKRRFRRIHLSENDGIYCIVVKTESAGKTITLPMIDFSQKGFKFAVIPKMKDQFYEGEKLFLKAIAGSRNLTFAEPVELLIRWQNIDIKRNTVNIGCEICSIATESDKQFIDFIRSEVKFAGAWKPDQLYAQPNSMDSDPRFDPSAGDTRKVSVSVVSIFGGPRESGNTATILGWVEEQLKLLGHHVERINLLSKEVNGCLGCLRCKDKPGEPGCIQKDDATYIIDRMVASDVVIYASPLYYWGFSAQMKALIDRCQCLYRGEPGSPEHSSFVDGRRQALIVTAADSFENNAEQILTTFQRMLACHKTHCSGELLVCNCRTP